MKQSQRLEILEKEVAKIKTQVRRLRSTPGTTIVPITTLAPEPFDLRKEIPVVVQAVNDEYVATFYDANINASGTTETDAVRNLIDVMLGLFEYLSCEPARRLGPGPARQLAVLKNFIGKKA